MSKYIMEVKVIGDLFEDNGHGSMAGRVYDTDGQCPALGASHFQQIKYILDKKNVSEVKELGFMDNETQQIKVLTEVDMNPKLLGGIGEKWGDKQYRQGNRVYDANGVAMALTAQPLGNNGGNSYMYLTEEKSIVAMRGRNPENPSDRTVGAPTEQRLEPNSQGICNTLTSVTKDNLVLEKNVAALRMVRTEEGKALRKQYENHEITHGFNEHRVAEPREDNCSNTLSTVLKDNMLLESTNLKYRIRKLTPRECYRLMAVPEESIDKMLEVNSNTQCYKQAGNSIVVNCLVAIFSQMGIQGIPRWNEGLSEKYK